MVRGDFLGPPHGESAMLKTLRKLAYAINKDLFLALKIEILS